MLILLKCSAIIIQTVIPNQVIIKNWGNSIIDESIIIGHKIIVPNKDIVIKSILDILSKETESLVFLILEDQIRYFGITQLFKYSEFKNIEKLKIIFSILEDDTYITARPSGTEPKIKFYFSVNDKSEELAEKKLSKTMKDFTETLKL